jgi:alkylresorcinol/alkylpyrone synthase
MADLMMREKNRGIVLSVSVEICSATFQMDDDPSLIISNALFADGASAAVLWSRPEGFEMIASSNFYATEHRDTIRYVYKKGQLHNHLSVRLPRLVKEAAAKAVRSLLKKNSLRVEDIKHWALHTGGEKIIDAIKNEIGLSENQLQATRRILAEYGNMSSPTVWFVVREILKKGINGGDLCLLVTFGAGLSAHAFLLRKV